MLIPMKKTNIQFSSSSLLNAKFIGTRWPRPENYFCKRRYVLYLFIFTWCYIFEMKTKSLHYKALFAGAQQMLILQWLSQGWALSSADADDGLRLLTAEVGQGWVLSGLGQPVTVWRGQREGGCCNSFCSIFQRLKPLPASDDPAEEAILQKSRCKHHDRYQVLREVKHRIVYCGLEWPGKAWGRRFIKGALAESWVILGLINIPF